MKTIAKLALVTVASFALLGAQNLSAQTFKVDPVHSFLVLKVKHLEAGYSWGRFNDIAGTVTLNEADPSKSVVDLTVKTASIDTGNAKRDDHLRNADFFNAKQFPTITFKSTKVVKVNDKTLEVTGDFTVLGVTKSATATVDISGAGKGMQGEERIGFDTTFTVKRTDFGMNFMVGPLADEVRIFLSIEGIKE